MQRTRASTVPGVRHLRWASSLSTAPLVVLAAMLGFADSVAAQDPRVQVGEGALRGVVPDLVGSVVAIISSTPFSYRSWSLVVKNRNRMDATAAFSVELYRQGSLVASKVISGLPGNTEVSLGMLTCWVIQPMNARGVPCPWPVGYGCADSWIIVDVKNAVAESSESNNKYEFCWGAQTKFSPAP